MIKKIMSLLCFAGLLMSSYTVVSAVTCFEDFITDTSKIDMIKTGAAVDIIAHKITLPRNPVPSALDIAEFEQAYAVISTDGANYYTLDEETGKAVLNPSLSLTGINNPVGVALSRSNPSMWIVTDTELKRYEYTGGGLSNNPMLNVTGLQNVLSVSTFGEDSLVAVLTKSMDGTGVVTTYTVTDTGSIANIQEMSFQTGLANPISVAATGNYCLAVSSSTEVRYYSWDADMNEFVRNSFMTTTGLTDTAALCLQNDGYGYVTASQGKVSYYLYDSASSSMQVVSDLSVDITDVRPISVSLKAGSYEYAVLTGDGTVQYWQYDAGSDSMVRNSNLETTGNIINNAYVTPKDYCSKAFTTAAACNQVKLTVTTVIPEGTDISFSVSSDDGVTFLPLINGTWTAIPDSSSFTVKAVLSTADTAITPEIRYIKLEAAYLSVENLVVIGITSKPPMQPVPTDIMPVSAKRGSQVVFTVDTSGYVTSIRSTINGRTTDMIPVEDTAEEENIWVGTFSVPTDAPDNTVYTLDLTAAGLLSEQSMTAPNFVRVEGDVYKDFDLKMTY